MAKPEKGKKTRFFFQK